MKKTLSFILFTILSLSISAQNYHELARVERRTITCESVLELGDGNIVSLEDEGYSGDAGWVYEGVYIMKMNNKAELMDSLYIDFPYSVGGAILINNPYENGNNLFAKMYYNNEDGQYHYKAVFFDDNLSITDMIDVPVICDNTILKKGSVVRPFLNLDNNWIVGGYDNNNNYVFLTIDLWGNLIHEKATIISSDKHDRVHECLFVYDKEEKLYGFFTSDIFVDQIYPNITYQDGHSTVFVMDEEYNIIATLPLFSLGNATISPSGILTSKITTKETGEIVLISTTSGQTGHSYLQITELDKEMNVIRYKRLDKNINPSNYEFIIPQYSPISLRKDGYMYVNWYTYRQKEEHSQQYVTLLDNSLNIVWETLYYESHDAWVMGVPAIASIQTLENDNLVMAGTSVYDYSDWKSTHPLVLVFEDNSTSTSENHLADAPYSFYPNPARDFIKLSAVSGQLSAVRVYNTLGMLVEEFEMQSNEIEINVSDYKSGMYFINISTDNGDTFTEKVVVR